MITKLITHAQARMMTFRRDESGATMVEYGVALLVVLGIGLAVVTALGTSIKGIFQEITTALNSA
jgi:Flp pilus assembly pilin Flp